MIFGSLDAINERQHGVLLNWGNFSKAVVQIFYSIIVKNTDNNPSLTNLGLG